MRVANLTAWHVRIPLRKPIQHASHIRSETDNLIVRCTLADGTVGFGEGVPREYVTGETIDSTMDLLAKSDLKTQFEPCSDFKAAVALAERLHLNPIRGDDRGCQGNGSRCALELALLDAYGRKFGLPVSAVVNLIAPDLLEPKPWVQYSGAITTGSLGLKIRALAFGMWLYGFRHLKVKVGIEGHDDVQRLRIIRRRAGARMDVRVDANEAWPSEVVADRMAALKPFHLSAIEQPVKHEEIDCLRKARQQTGMAVMLDESLCGMVDAQRAVEGQLCDSFNIRLSKCGGFIPSLRLAPLSDPAVSELAWFCSLYCCCCSCTHVSSLRIASRLVGNSIWVYTECTFAPGEWPIKAIRTSWRTPASIKRVLKVWRRS